MSIGRTGMNFDDVDVRDNAVFRVPPRPKRVSPEERLFSSVLYAAELAHRQGLPVTVDALRDVNERLPAGKVVDLFATERFQQAMVDRGIPLLSETGLSAEQLHALAIYFDTSIQANHSQRLRLIGVPAAKWQSWMRTPSFAAEMAGLSEERLRASQPVALQRVGEAVDRGERWAIELSLEMTKRHDRRKETTDPRELLLLVFNVLDEAGVPNDVLALVAAKIKARMGAEQAPVMQISPAVRESEEG